MKDFIYDIPTKVYFGRETEKKIGDIIASYNPHKVLIHYGSNSAEKSGLLSRTEGYLNDVGINYIKLGGVKPNPSLQLVRAGIDLCIKEEIDFILAVGGGSVIDSAKAIANGAANPDVDVWDFSLHKAVPEKTLPKAVILTLSAAGSEMSDSVVITNEDTNDKRGYCCPYNRIDVAIENPELTYGVSPFQTACGTVDISMHSIERYFTMGTKAEVTDSVSLAIIKEAIKAGKKCLKNPQDYNARAEMMWASSISHNGLTHCGKDYLLTVHQLEHELSGMYHEIAHGAGLAALWCSWARYVYKANPEKWIRYVTSIWDIPIDKGNSEATIVKGIKCQEDFYHSIGMPVSLRELNVKKTDLPELALKCSRNHTRVIPGYKPLDYDDMLNIYQMAYDVEVTN